MASEPTWLQICGETRYSQLLRNVINKRSLVASQRRNILDGVDFSRWNQKDVTGGGWQLRRLCWRKWWLLVHNVLISIRIFKYFTRIEHSLRRRVQYFVSVSFFVCYPQSFKFKFSFKYISGTFFSLLLIVVSSVRKD